MVLVAIQLSVIGLYLPPSLLPPPPHTINSVPVQTPVRFPAGSGAFVVLVAVQLSVVGLYFPPVFKLPKKPLPPHTIISLPVQTAV